LEKKPHQLKVKIGEKLIQAAMGRTSTMLH
jgi:hypothetical protein